MEHNSHFKVGFYTIKCRGKLNSNYQSLGEILRDNGFVPLDFTEFPITRQNLATIDILVIPCPDNNKFSKNEIQAIKTWVNNDGGGLLMLSHAGGDKGRRTNLTEVAEQFGMIFENNQVLDKFNNLGVENLPVIEDWAVPHPIVENLTKIVFRAGCSLTISSTNVSPVFSSGSQADPFETPLMLASEDGEGRVVALGSYEMFRDKISGGIRQEDHKTMAINVFNWLKTTRREQIRAGVVASEPIEPQNFAPSSEETPTGEISERSASYHVSPNNSQYAYAIPAKTYQSDVKILAKEDLLLAFERTLKEFYNFKQAINGELNRFENNLALLMKAVLASEEDMINLRQQQVIEETTEFTAQQNAQPAASNPAAAGQAIEVPTDGSEYKEGKPQRSGEGRDLEKGEIASTEVTPDEISKDLATNGTKTRVISPPPTPKEQKAPTKEELMEELANLQNKLDSIKNLKAFVEKKHGEGKLKDSRYDKQMKKLNTDSQNAYDRIKEIELVLEKL